MAPAQHTENPGTAATACARLGAMHALPAVALALLVLAAPAAAAEARASGDAPVRLRPHGSAPIIDRLHAGLYYEVEDCTRQALWCLVSDDGYELGWVRGSQLIGAAAKIPVTPFEFLVNPDFRDKD